MHFRISPMVLERVLYRLAIKKSVDFKVSNKKDYPMLFVTATIFPRKLTNLHLSLRERLLNRRKVCVLLVLSELGEIISTFCTKIVSTPFVPRRTHNRITQNCFS